jgi:hypothetical protein
MRYANKEAQEAFSGRENYDMPLALLEESFRRAGLNVGFVCAIAADGEKIVSILPGRLFAKATINRMQ